MENASKALIIAGSVLLSVLIISALAFLYNNIKGVEQTKNQTQQEKKIAEFEKQIEMYNKDGLYGSEILSLVNLIEDFNKKYTADNGYIEETEDGKIPKETIAVTIKINPIQEIEDIKFFSKNEYAGKRIKEQYNALQKEIKDCDKTVKDSCGTNAEKIANMNEASFEQFIEEKNLNNVKEKIRKNSEKYLNLTSVLTEFKRKKFKKPTVEYYKISRRISKMTFEEY